MAEAFDPGRRASSPNLTTTSPPFVGRHVELQRLDGWLREVTAGQSRIVLIEGDAGIGKTRLLQELRSSARILEMQVCFGRCYEDLALPYLPFVEGLFARFAPLVHGEQLAPADADVVRRLLRGGASIAEADPALPEHADQDKLRMFLAVARATVRLAQGRPTVLLVDDLHWADPRSLDLFEHLGFTVADAAERARVPLLIAATYRPPEAGERLSRLIARLQREDICRALVLDGLDEPAINELVGGLGVGRPSHQLTATIREATRGNPLFIQEVLHHLVQQGALQEQGGYLVAGRTIGLRLPEHVTGAIVGRVARLSEDCRKILTLASFLGDRFSLEAMAVVSGLSEEALLGPLEEGAGHRLLRSEGRAFQFSHPLIRHVLYQEPSVARRERIHRQIAESLERLYGEGEDEHLLEIAHHLVRAGAAAPAEAVGACARRAGDRAFGMFAWGDAAHYYEAALAAGESTGRLAVADRASLHYSAGLAHYYNQDVGPCLHHYERAIEAYRATGDLPGLARALMEKTRTRFTLATVPLGVLVDIKPLEDILATLGDREPGLRGHVLAVMAEAYRNGRQAAQARHRAEQALEIGRQLGDDHLCAYAGFALGMAHGNDLELTEALECWRRARGHARRSNDLIREGWALHRMPVALTLLGRLGEARAIAREACALTRTSSDWSNHSVGLSNLAAVAVAGGDFAETEGLAHETMLMVSRSRYPWGGLRSLLALACGRALRGAWAEAEDALAVLVEPGRVFDDAGPVIQAFARVFRQYLHAHAGVADPGLDALAAELMRVAGADTYSLAPLCALLELSDLRAMPAIAEAPYQALARAEARGILFSTGWMFLLPRVLGNADAARGRWDAADTRFQAAVAVATEAGARPELGRTYLDHARVLAAQGGRGARERAAKLLIDATAIFLELGMQPFVRAAAELAETLRVGIPMAPKPPVLYPDGLSEREVDVLLGMARGRTGEEIAGDLLLLPGTVAGHMSNITRKTNVDSEVAATAYAHEKNLGPAVGRPRTSAPAAGGARDEPAAQALRIILVSDVVASAALIRHAGDEKAHGLIQEHNTIIRDCLAAFQGVEVTHTGDGVEAAFSSASRAVECAIEIQRAFARHNEARPDQPIHVRIGLNAGEPIATEGRLFGAAVHTAFRICERAGAGQILVSEVIRQLVTGRGFSLIGRGRVTLRGLPERIRLYEVPWKRTV
jgi:class 3 adenylate cyclase/tetratricopeptide (TPR) repeat protein